MCFCFPFAEQCEKHIIPDFMKKSSQVAPQDNGSSSGPTNSKWSIRALVPYDISQLIPWPWNPKPWTIKGLYFSMLFCAQLRVVGS